MPLQPRQNLSAEQAGQIGELSLCELTSMARRSRRGEAAVVAA
jgi:hypothetical protein